MNSKDLIKPVEFIGVGQCFRCTTPLIIFENELTSLVLDQNGLPTNHEVEYYNIIGVCPTCKHTYKMERKGMHYKRASIFDFQEENDSNQITEEKIDNPFREE